MTPARRAGAPRLIEWTGERCVPWAPDIQVVYEHLHRYMWAAPLLAGRRVLDLGSGEGFGAAILAGSASEVIGIDIDERTVEHSSLNYAGPNLQFQLGTALDLSAHEDGSFGAVVAFEVIEHVLEQERVLAEIARVLTDDGILVISTPDRRAYSEATGNENPFHARELAQEEFLGLLGTEFAHTATWGQRTITGSYMRSLADDAAGPEPSDFFIERAGEEWRTAGDPAAMYLIALASRSPLPSAPRTSTLADCGLELLRARERDAAERENELKIQSQRTQEYEEALQRERSHHARQVREDAVLRREEVEVRDLDIQRAEEDLQSFRERIAALGEDVADRERRLDSLAAELDTARQLNRRTEESVTWQAFQSARARLYGAIGGEGSLLARALGFTLRALGSGLRRGRDEPQEPAAPAAGEPERELITMPQAQDPAVSLVIPVFSGADLTLACLKSIRERTTHVAYEVILVDDDADEETKELLERVHGARILRNDENLGYLRSMNRGASIARGRWLVLFNNDTEVREGWLRAMLDCAESAGDIGVVTPKFIYPDGCLNEAGAVIWRDGTGVNYGRGDPPDLFQYEYRRETDYGSAAALMVNTELWNEIGGFDERFMPMYYEDVDICFAARERGKRVMYEPAAVVVHLEGGTVGTDTGAGLKRHQEENEPKFRSKWRRQLESEQRRTDPTNLRVAADRHRGPHVLIIDHIVPEWDRDAGSLRMLHIMRALIGIGAHVTFMPDHFSPTQPYTRELQEMGVKVMYGALDVRAELATIGPGLSMAIISRPHTAGRWLDLVREYAPAAKILYDTVDLHWLREMRRNAVESAHAGENGAQSGRLDLTTLSPRAKALRHLELAMIRASDVTVVVSESERAQVLLDVPSAAVAILPTVHEVTGLVIGPQDRSGILFVGSFRHPPNAGAVVRLVRDVMPAVWQELPGVPVTIVGADAPPEVRALASPLVDVVGWVEDLQPLFDEARALVAPLRYGAGLNGKITQSLAVGLPVVTTHVGADGLEGLADCVLVAEEAGELADCTVRLCTDDALWRERSAAGRDLIVARCSPAIIAETLDALLRDVPAASLGRAGGRPVTKPPASE